MKPVAFDYERPRTLNAACALLASEDLLAKPLAGGQSLGPMLNMRLVQPDLLVDITRIPELWRVEEDKSVVVEIGACITHAAIEDGCVPGVTGGILASVAGGIAYRAVRNRGTIGGSLAHADPAADWVACLAALGAEVVLHGPAGQRTLPLGGFVVGALEVALEAGEVLEAVRVPILSPNARWGFYKFCRKTGEFAEAIGAVVHDPDRGVARAVIGATHSRPIVLEEASVIFGTAASGGRGSFDRNAASELMKAAGLDPDPYFFQVHLVALERAVDQL